VTVGATVVTPYGGAEAMPSTPTTTVGGVRRRLLLRRVVGAVLTSVGLLIVLLVLFVYAFTPLVAGRDQHRLLGTLTSSSQNTFALTKGTMPAEGRPLGVLRIPALGLSQVVVAGTSAKDLVSGPGLMPGTVLPGEQGNAVIAGRRTTFGGPFGSIGTLHRGDVISVTDGVGAFRYVVASVRTVPSGERAFGGTTDDRLTLVTSNSSLDATGLEMVVSHLVGRSVVTPASVSHAIPAGERGLSGQPLAAASALFWALLFLLAAAGTGFALWRWRRPWPTYLLAAPILLACGLFVVESVALMLPATV